MNFLNKILAIPLGYLMKGCYWLINQTNLPLRYVFTLFLFTLATKIIMFPLMMKQQKSTAAMSAFSTQIKDIQTRYKNNPEKQNEELAKLQELGYNPTAGCLPMLINLLIMFGLVEVIYKPLTYMLTCPSELISALTEKTLELAAAAGQEISTKNNRMIETTIIGYVQSNKAAFQELFSKFPAEMNSISDLQMTIGRSIRLYETPTFKSGWALLIPLFSIVTQLFSTVVTMKASGTNLDENAARQTKSMMLTTSIMFAVFSFMYPMGFSLYWGFQNLVSMVQSLILRKMYDPEEMKKELEEKIKAKRKEKNSRKTITYTDTKTGEQVQKEVSASESDRIRLQRAHEIDAQRYGDE